MPYTDGMNEDVILEDRMYPWLEEEQYHREHQEDWGPESSTEDDFLEDELDEFEEQDEEDFFERSYPCDCDHCECDIGGEG